MSNRADVYALRSLFALGTLIALLLIFRICNVGEWLMAAPSMVATTAKPLPSSASPSLPSVTRFFPSQEASSSPENYVVAPTPIPVTPIRVPPLTHLLVEPSKWSAPLYIPEGKSVGIKFALGRIRIERDGSVVPGILYRSPPVVPVGDAISLRPLASLDHRPRVFWFGRGIRVLRFLSLEKKQSEKVEVLWSNGESEENNPR